MASGRYTARQIAELYLRRIEELDRSGPDAALGDRAQSRRARASPTRSTPSARPAGPRGPLHGIPVLIKDNIDTGDRMMTTAGSLALEGSIAAARRLHRRAAARGRRGDSRQDEPERVGELPLDAFDERLERARRPGANPYALDRNPCGSSSGTGAAIAANLAAVGVGTETDGSIVCPSARTASSASSRRSAWSSRSGIIPISHTQDTAGPMARTVADAAMLLGAMAGVDPRDAATAREPTRTRERLHAALDADGLKGARIGVARKQLLRLQRRRPIALVERGDRRDEGAGRGHRRSGRHPDGGEAATTASSRCCSTSSRRI